MKTIKFLAALAIIIAVYIACDKDDGPNRQQLHSNFEDVFNFKIDYSLSANEVIITPKVECIGNYTIHIVMHLVIVVV